MPKRTKAELMREIEDLRAQLAAAADRESALLKAGQAAEQKSGAGGEEKESGEKALAEKESGGKSAAELLAVSEEDAEEGLLLPSLSLKKRAFLEAYIDSGGRVQDAAQAAGVSRWAHQYWRKTDKAFAAAFEAAQPPAFDVLRDEIIRRARGWDEPVYYGGKRVDTVRKHSDLLLIFEAKRRDPLYRDNPQQALVQAGGDIRVHLNVPRPGQEGAASEKKRPKVQIEPAIDVEARELPG